MAQTLSVKVDAQVTDFSRNLDQAGRRWEKFGRDLGQGSRALSQSFGQTSGALGGLARSFQAAGNAAGIFAGVDGLLGIAGSLAVGGPILAGIAALTLGVTLLSNRAEEGKKKLDAYNQSLERFAAVAKQMGGAAGQHIPSLILEQQRRFDEAQSRRNTELAKQGKLSFLGPLARFAQDDENLKRFEGDMKRASDQMVILNAQWAALAPDAATARLKAQNEELERMARFARAMNQGAFLQAWRLHQPGFPGGINQAGAAAAIRGTVVPEAMSRRLDAGLLDKSPAEYLKQLEEQAHFLRLVELDLQKVDGTLESGFQNLAPQLASILGTLLGGLFAGSGKGAQIGAGLGGAFGGGLGSGLAGKVTGKIAGAIAGSVFPVIGGAIGGLLGGAIGGLFGGHKKKVDENAAAFERLNRTIEKVNASISNLPTGYKLEHARFRSAEPGVPPIPPSGPVGPIEPPPGGGPEPIDPTIPRITIGTINLPGVANAAQFIRELSRIAEQMTARGGTTGFSTALIRVT